MTDPQKVSADSSAGVVDTMRRRWRLVALVGGALGGLVAIGTVFEVANKALDAYKRTIDVLGPRYCDGQPIDEVRVTMWRNINSGGAFYSAARVRANKLLECSKEDHDALNALGAVEFYTANYSLAEQYFRRAIKSKPDARGLHLNFADTLVELGRYEAALAEYKAFDNGTVALTYKIARTHLLELNFAEARRLLATVSSDFADEAQAGKARILEAAALVGLAQQESGPARDQLLSAARRNFLEGLNKERAWWIEILTARSSNRYEPFNKVAAILGDKISEWSQSDSR